LCEHRRPTEYSRASSLKHRPQRGDRRGGKPETKRGVLVKRFKGPHGRTRDGRAHFLESGQRRRLRWGRARATANAGGRVVVSDGPAQGHSCDRRKRPGGATAARPGRPGSPPREPALTTETAREQSTRRARCESSLERGVDRSKLRPRGRL